jgi:signal transduction histidine kinase/CheY-like chemotaxis protein
MLPRTLSTLYTESHSTVLLLIANLHHMFTQDSSNTYDKSLVLNVIEEIKSYIDIESLSRTKNKRFLLEDVIAKTINQYCLKASRKAIQFNIVSAADPIQIEGHAPLVKIILNNLISNAIKYTKQGDITLQISTLQDSVEIKVIDTGAGIDPHTVAALFDQKQLASKASSERGNSGLGLVNCLRIAECVQGSLIATSEGKGKGSCFSLRIPTQMTLNKQLLQEIFDESFIHHEIRNLLSTLLTQESLPDAIREDIESIISLVTDLLDYALLEQGKLQLSNTTVDLKQFMPGAENSIVIKGDPSRVAQIINHFQHLSSAQKAAFEMNAETVQWRLRLSDKYTADDLPAQVCQRLLAMMGGKIDITENETLISCTFPREIVQDIQAEAVKKKILIIEDTEMTIMFLKRSLTRLGHEVVTATTAAQALEKTSQTALAKERYDAILTDFHIERDGLTGLDLAKKIKQSEICPAIYLLSGDNIAREVYEPEGVKLALQKPVSIETLSSIFGNPANYVPTPVSSTSKLMPDSPLQTRKVASPSIPQLSVQQTLHDFASPK